MPPRFITFEGVDGCGKSTQLRLLSEALQRASVTHLVTHEPGGSPLGTALRDLLLHQPHHLPARAELLLFAADRAVHVEQVIRPALAAGQWVLCDRYLDSTTAYQAGGLQLDAVMVQQVNSCAVQGLLPDLTLLFDLEPAVGLQRLPGGQDKIEARGVEFGSRVRRKFQDLAAADPNRFAVLDGALTVRELAGQVRQAVHTRLAVSLPS